MNTLSHEDEMREVEEALAIQRLAGRTLPGHEALLRDMAIPDPEMSILAHKAAMFDRLVDVLDDMYTLEGMRLPREDSCRLLARETALDLVNACRALQKVK